MVRVSLMFGFVVGLGVWFITHLLDREHFRQERLADTGKAEAMRHTLSLAEAKLRVLKTNFLELTSYDAGKGEEYDRYISVVGTDFDSLELDIDEITRLVDQEKQDLFENVVGGREKVARSLLTTATIIEKISLAEEQIDTVTEKVKSLVTDEILGFRQTG